MMRAEWEFKFTSDQLAQAAREKVAHHAARLEFWTAAQEKVMQEVRERGLSVEMSLDPRRFDGTSRGSYAPAIVVDETFQRRLNEASDKIKHHKETLAQYEGWVQVLEANGGRTYPLNADDFLYFFGK